MKNGSKVITAGIAALVLATFIPAATFADQGSPLHQLPTALSASDLSQLSGGESPKGVAVTNQTLSATNVGNTVNAESVVTGDVTLQSGAFGGFSGVGNFVFNTGNNNNLQGTLSVTVVAPPVN